MHIRSAKTSRNCKKAHAISENSDQAVQSRSLICNFTGRTSLIVGFVVRWLKWCLTKYGKSEQALLLFFLTKRQTKNTFQVVLKELYDCVMDSLLLSTSIETNFCRIPFVCRTSHVINNHSVSLCALLNGDILTSIAACFQMKYAFSFSSKIRQIILDIQFHSGSYRNNHEYWDGQA